MARPDAMTLAVVDDDDDVRTALNRLLKAMGYRVVAFASAEDFEARSVEVDCAIIDMRLPGVSGLELCERLRQRLVAAARRPGHGRRPPARRRPARRPDTRSSTSPSTRPRSRTRSPTRWRAWRPTVPTEDRYRRAAAAGGVSVWDWNLATGDIFVDPLTKELLGYGEHEIPNRVEDWGRLVHPDDLARVAERARPTSTTRRRPTRPSIACCIATAASAGSSRGERWCAAPMARPSAWPGPAPTSPSAGAARRRSARPRR